MIKPIFLPVKVINPIQGPAKLMKQEIPLPESPASQPTSAPSSDDTIWAIIVCGVDYPEALGEYVNGGFDYRDAMSKRLFLKYGEKLKVVTFECKKGLKQIVSGTLVDKKKVQLKIESSESFATYKASSYRYMNYRHTAREEISTKYVDGYYMYFPGITKFAGTSTILSSKYLKAYNEGKITIPKTIGIKNVYDEIISIGKSHPGKLKEVHFFSHSYSEGPILVNTPSWVGLLKEKVLDMDGRISDFKQKDDAISNRDLFKSAFDDDGFMMLWGCDVNHQLQEMVNQAMKKEYFDGVEVVINKYIAAKDDDERSKAYDEARDVLEARIIIFEYNGNWRLDLEGFHDYVGDGDGEVRKTNKSELHSVLDVILKLFVEIRQSYFNQWSNLIELPCVAPPPGTSTLLDTPEQRKYYKHQLMHVAMDKVKDAYGYEKLLSIYSIIPMDFYPTDEFDKGKFGRGYIVGVPENLRNNDHPLISDNYRAAYYQKFGKPKPMVEALPTSQPQSQPSSSPASMP